jgi:hypothetical protein
MCGPNSQRLQQGAGDPLACPGAAIQARNPPLRIAQAVLANQVTIAHPGHDQARPGQKHAIPPAIGLRLDESRGISVGGLKHSANTDQAIICQQARATF